MRGSVVEKQIKDRNIYISIIKHMVGLSVYTSKESCESVCCFDVREYSAHCLVNY